MMLAIRLLWFITLYDVKLHFNKQWCFLLHQRVGCDRVLGSTAVPDACGVCKGDNSTCKIYKGQYTKQHYTNRKS